jgi:hypothetical protein
MCRWLHGLPRLTSLTSLIVHLCEKFWHSCLNLLVCTGSEKVFQEGVNTL